MSIVNRLLNRSTTLPRRQTASITSRITSNEPTRLTPSSNDALGVSRFTQPTERTSITSRITRPRLGGAQEETSQPSLRFKREEQAQQPRPTFQGQEIRGTLGLDSQTPAQRDIKRREEKFRLDAGQTSTLPVAQRRVDIQESNIRQDIAKQESDRITQRINELKREQGVFGTRNLAEIAELNRQRTSQTLQAKPEIAGFLEGASAGLQSKAVENLKPELQQGFQQATQEEGFKQGQLSGTIARNISQYAVLGGLLKGSQIGQKILGGAGASTGRRILGQQGVDLLIDTIVQSPDEYFEAIREDKTIGQAAKDFAINRGIDVLFNVAIGGLTGDLNKARRTLDTPSAQEAMKSVGLDPTETLKVLDSGNQQAIKTIQDNLNAKVANFEPTKPQSITQRLTAEPEVKAFQEGEVPQFDDLVIRTGPESPTKPLSDLPKTEDLVLTELPKRPKGDIRDFADRTYQELVSKNAPFERIGKLAKDETLTARAGNLNRTTGTIDYNISKAQSDMQGNDIGLSMQDIFKDIPEAEKRTYFDYMLNKHNIDRFQEGKPVFGDAVTEFDSTAKVRALEAQNPNLVQTQKNVTNYFDKLNQEWAVKSGLISNETAQFLKDKYPNYVPTYRALDIDRAMGGGSGNFVSQVIKKAKGSEKQILPLDQQMAMLTDRTIRNARKNEVMLQLDDVFTANPEAVGRYIKSVSDVEAKPVTDILDIGSELEREVVKKGNDFVVTYYKNGEPKQMTVNETLYNAMRKMEQTYADKGLNVIRKYATNPFKSLITTYNPLFAVRNVMRDVPTALMYSNNPLKMIQSVPEATKQMLNNGDLWKKYQALGGTRSGLFNYDKGVKFDFAGDTGFKETAKKAITGVGEKAEALNNFTETLPRFSEFVASMKETGGNEALSLMRAAEVTTDFSRFGNITKKADAVVPYLNASVQGIDRFARQMRNKPLETIARGGVVITAPTLILDQINKNNDAYNEMSARERNQYYHIPKEDGTFWRIPRSREVGALLGTTFEWLARSMRGQEVTPEEVMSIATENFTPVNGFDSNILKPAGNFWKIVSGSDPDAKNFFGSKIIPTSLQKYSPSQQFDEKTTSIAKNLGAFLDVSPKAIDYLMDSYLGVIGDVGMPYLTDQKVDHLAPLERAFIADPVFKSEAQNNFYDSLDKLRKESNDFNQANEVPSKIVTPLEKQVSMLNKVSRQLSDLRKEQKAAQTAGDDDKVRALRQAMNELSKNAINDTIKEEELEKQLAELLQRLNK